MTTIFIVSPSAAGFPHDVLHEICSTLSPDPNEAYATDDYEVHDTTTNLEEARQKAKELGDENAVVI